MYEYLPKVYIISFSIGPAYYLLNFLLACVVGQEFNSSSSDSSDVSNFDTDDIIPIESYTDDISLDDTDTLTQDFETSNDLVLNIFSPKIWVAIITGFGFGGYFSMEMLNKSETSSLVFATMTGLLVGTFLFTIISYLYSHTSINDAPIKIIDRMGIVTLSIPYKKVGLVRIEFEAGNQEFRAISSHRRKLKKGEAVRVINYIQNKHLLIVKENK